ncbi:hypothetical protein L208DRAFT_1119482, partial [Tricholoma matsutake]
LLLNLCSRLVTYHPAVTTLMLWDSRAPKRLIPTFNRYNIVSISVEVGCSFDIQLVKSVANDKSKIKLFLYDNFNWMSRAWEASALHGTISHDQVSALLTVLPIPEGIANPLAQYVATMKQFAESAGTRHCISPDTSFTDIIPSANDVQAFCNNSALYITYILSQDQLPISKTKEYFLPTYDQEQSSTQGYMLVLRHYFQDVLSIPDQQFESETFFFLGDRLTTACDRAAQDQHVVDCSESSADHLSSYTMLSGIMHVCMSMVQVIGKNFWGSSNADSVSLLTLLKALPNHGDINLQKINCYAWLCFLNVILRALVIKATISELNLTSPANLDNSRLPLNQFIQMCKKFAENFVLPSVDRLEADGIKTLHGNTVSLHAVLLMHDIMTMHEMQHAVKHGHPERLQCMLKYWTPMFYAGRGYNYSNECMELLHNLIHDWPKDTALILHCGRVTSPTRQPHHFQHFPQSLLLHNDNL